MNPSDGEEDWTKDVAQTFLAGGVGLLSHMAVRATNADGGGLAVLNVSSKSRELMYVTDDLAERIDELQFVIGEGPCLDAYLSGDPRTAADLASEGSLARWPAFAREAGGAGASAIFAYPVRSGSSSIGVLEFYRYASGPLKEQEHRAALQYAEVLGTVLNAAWRGLLDGTDELEADYYARVGSPPGLNRWHLHVAAGMVAEQLGVSVSDAIDRVRAFTYASGRRLVEISDAILARRVTLPGRLDV